MAVAHDLARAWVADGRVSALACETGTSLEPGGGFAVGHRDVAGTTPLPETPIFLVASITKPIVAWGALLLVERGAMTLGDRVIDWLPEFGRHGKSGIEVRHLLTHTSGLPDMLPNNVELRQAHAPLSRFLAETCDQPLAFPPGRGVQYQSTGFLVLAEIIERVSGRPCARFLREEVFTPLGMRDTVLGAPQAWYEHADSPLERLVEVRLPPEQPTDGEWHWNSRYWRQLGAPWGGLLTTTDDLGRLARCLLRGGRGPEETILCAPATIAAATRNQLDGLRELPELERRTRPWGLGWRLHWPAHSANFGDLLTPRAYGHWGATGTLLWIDPGQDRYAVILSNQPQEPTGHFLSRMSNVLAAAWG
jgi:CubicO group peptidase (beta-lactamase class C family)